MQSCCYVKMYLLAYNLISATLWTFLLINLITICFRANKSSLENLIPILYNETGNYLAYVQSLAILEIFHALFGWVNSNPMTNAIQVGSRLVVIWVAGEMVRVGDKHWSYGVMAAAWAISDIIRYIYYATNLVNIQIPLIKDLRYNLFLILYPIGTACEVMLLNLARMKLAVLDFNWHWALFIQLIVYAPGNFLF
jgi:very-long-chain (3R)-3-hydroxyacyl-CoA dehydratase